MREIIYLSKGYPYFTHLLALKCAEEAIVNGRKTIALEHLHHATTIAANDSEGTLARQYQDAIRSYNRNLYKEILIACAGLNQAEFSAANIRDAMRELIGREVTQGELNNHFQRLVSDDGTRILQRLSKGVYRFSDPRMPCYIQISNHSSVS